MRHHPVCLSWPTDSQTPADWGVSGSLGESVCQISAGLGGPESNHLSFLWKAKFTLAVWSAVLCPSFKRKDFFYESFHIVIISTKLLHLLAGARHRLPPLWLAAEWLCDAYHWLPEGEWEEHSPHPSPVAERVKAKTPSLPIIWVILGFGASECVSMVEREKR